MGAITAICSDQKQPPRKSPSSASSPKLANKTSSTQSKYNSYDSTIISSLQSIPHSPLSASTQMKNDQNQPEEEQQVYDSSGRKYMGISDFEVVGELGSGKFGKVYKVILKDKFQDQTRRTYALKKMSRKQLDSKKSIQNLKLQREILMNGDHQFLTKLKFSFADENSIYFVMDCAEGGSVESLLTLNKIKGSKKNHREKMFREMGQFGVKLITASVVLGLEELHKHNIMYRDLKPENILIFSDGYIKLADFGLSKILQDNIKTKTQAGTVNYFAPEVVMRTGYTRLIDFWTLGVFIYELATSDSPFRQDEILTRSTFKQKVERAEIDRDWKGYKLSEELKDLINKLLKYKPQQRLGAHGFHQIKAHPFFKDIDWQKLLNKQIESPLLSLINAYPTKMSGIKDKSFIKKTFSFDIEKDEEWIYDFQVTKNKSLMQN